MQKHSPIIQKYGGTSVGTPERILKVAERVARFHAQGYSKLAVVVSAMSGETNRLVGLVKLVNPNASVRTRAYDMAVAAGEQVSVGLMAEALEALGVPSEPLLAYQLGIVTDESHGQAKIQSISTDVLNRCWSQAKVPVIAGFQGVTADMSLTTLGRGGSDTSAVALAAAVGAQFCEINTDVEGVYTADPRVVPEARLIESMDYETALELAALGGKVLHHRCVEVAAKYQVKLVVRSSFLDDSRSTTIMSFHNEALALEAPVVSGVTLDDDVARVTVFIPPDIQALASVFAQVSKHGVNVDIIVHDKLPDSQVNRVGFTMKREDLKAAVEAVKAAAVGGQELKIETDTRALAKVSAVGLGMRSHPGVATRVFETLAQAGIEVLMISTSEIKISCVVRGEEGKRAAKVLHDAFLS